MMLVSFPKCHLVYKSIKASNLKCIISIEAMERILTIYPLYSKIRGLYSQLKNTTEKYTSKFAILYWVLSGYYLSAHNVWLKRSLPKSRMYRFFCLIELQSALLCQNHIVLIKDFPAE